ncbi:MAG: hypothetical protein AAF768_07850 [Pseudomonadota bacterium]
MIRCLAILCVAAVVGCTTPNPLDFGAPVDQSDRDSYWEKTNSTEIEVPDTRGKYEWLYKAKPPSKFVEVTVKGDRTLRSKDYVAGGLGEPYPFEANLQVRTLVPGPVTVPRPWHNKLDEQTAWRIAFEQFSEEDLVRYTAHVAEQSFCKGGEVKLRESKERRFTGAALQDILAANQGRDLLTDGVIPEHLENQSTVVPSVEYFYNSWKILLSCSLWRKPTIDTPKSAAFTPPAAVERASLGADAVEVQTQQHADADMQYRDAFVGKTIRTYSKQHGTQIEYIAPHGTAYLWYPGNRTGVVSQWKTSPHPNHGHPEMCFRYGVNTFNPVTQMRGGQWECGRAARYVQKIREAVSGDPYQLQSRRIPFVLPESKEVSFETVSKQLN